MPVTGMINLSDDGQYGSNLQPLIQYLMYKHRLQTCRIVECSQGFRRNCHIQHFANLKQAISIHLPSNLHCQFAMIKHIPSGVQRRRCNVAV